jgi:hypothetical protein
MRIAENRDCKLTVFRTAFVHNPSRLSRQELRRFSCAIGLFSETCQDGTFCDNNWTGQIGSQMVGFV